jgi:hypothetical protein
LKPHTSFNEFVNAVIHNPPHPPRYLSEVSGAVLLEQPLVHISSAVTFPYISVVVTEPDISVHAANAAAVDGAHAVKADIFVSIIQQ